MRTFVTQRTTDSRTLNNTYGGNIDTRRHVLMEKGMRIPEDVAMIAFDNVETTQIAGPLLTTIDQPKYETGKTGVQM